MSMFLTQLKSASTLFQFQHFLMFRENLQITTMTVKSISWMPQKSRNLLSVTTDNNKTNQNTLCILQSVFFVGTFITKRSMRGCIPFLSLISLIFKHYVNEKFTIIVACIKNSVIDFGYALHGVKSDALALMLCGRISFAVHFQRLVVVVC